MKPLLMPIRVARGVIALTFCTWSLPSSAEVATKVIDLGLSSDNYEEGNVPAGWNLRKRSIAAWNGNAQWVVNNGQYGVKLHSDNALTFLEKTVDIQLQDYPLVTWRWKVDKSLSGIDETTPQGDDHAIRLFFIFDPDKNQQSLWFKVKRFIYLDLLHGHPFGGRFIEYLWSSHLANNTIISDPNKPMQKLIVVDGGNERLGEWHSYWRNLYHDYKRLYQEEPRRMIFVGILNDTDQTGQEALSYIADLKFSAADVAHKKLKQTLQ